MNCRKIPIAEILPDPDQGRGRIDPEGVAALADNMHLHGLLQPIRVRRNEALGRWVVVSGHRRLMAATSLGWTEIDAVEAEDESDEPRALAQQISENECREGMTIGDLARAVRKYKEATGATSRQAAQALGASESRVSRAEDYFQAPESVQRLSDAGKIPDRLITALARHPDPEAREALAEAYVQGRASVDDVAELARKAAGVKRPRGPAAKRLTLRLGPLSLAVDGEEASPESLLAALDDLRRELRKAVERGADLAAFARGLRAGV